MNPHCFIMYNGISIYKCYFNLQKDDAFDEDDADNCKKCTRFLIAIGMLLAVTTAVLLVVGSVLSALNG